MTEDKDQPELFICAKCKAHNPFELAPLPNAKNRYVLVCGVCGFVALPGTKIRLSVENGRILGLVGIGPDEEGKA